MLDRINANPNYSPEYKAKLIAAYRFFRSRDMSLQSMD